MAWINDALGDDCSLRVGWTLYEPFQIPQENGPPAGLDVEIIQRVAKRAGCTISEYREAPWTRLLVEVEQGRVDVVLSASYTASREEFGHYAGPYRAVRYAAFVHSNATIADKVRSIEEILGASPVIGTYRNGYLPPFIAERVEQAALAGRVIVANDYDKLFKLLVKGRLGVVLTEISDTTVNFQKVADDESIQGLEIEGSEDSVYFLFSRKSVSVDTVAKMDEAIESLKASDDYAALFRKYLGK